MDRDAHLSGASIHVIHDGQSKSISLDGIAVCRIGRGNHNTIVILDKVASRHHATIQQDTAGRYSLSDAGSRNGTTLNGRPVTMPTRLRDGDRITIGSQDLIFKQDEHVGEDTVDPTLGMTHGLVARKLITVLVVDFRNFTTLSREIGEDRISELMGTFFQAAGKLLSHKGSWAQKYIGDAVMAVWVHSQLQVNASELGAALDAVLELLSIVERLNRQFSLPRPLNFGAAINSGFAAIGNMGSAAMADFTALGDTVNRAFRLESSSKELQCDVVVGRATLDLVHPALPKGAYPQLCSIVMKGYDQPEDVYALSFSGVAELAERNKEHNRTA